MRLSVKGLGAATGMLWGGCMLACGLINLASPRYGRRFLQLMSSVYPGYRNSGTLADVLVGAGYGFVDGAAAGAILASVYNGCAQCSPARSADRESLLITSV